MFFSIKALAENSERHGVWETYPLWQQKLEQLELNQTGSEDYFRLKPFEAGKVGSLIGNKKTIFDRPTFSLEIYFPDLEL